MHTTQRISLEQIEIIDRCPMANLPVPLEQRRSYCDHCHKTVHNLSAMTRTEAEKLVCESAGAMCVQFSRQANGEVITLDYQPQTRRKWRWTKLGVLCAFLSAPVAFFGLSRATQRPPVVLGGISSVAGGIGPPVTTQPSATQPSTTQPVPQQRLPNVCDDSTAVPADE